MLFIFWDFIISWVVSCGDYLCCWIYLMLRTWHYVEMYLIPLWLYVGVLFMHDYMVIICRSDDYFLCIYLNCMIYCLIRNRVLHLFFVPITICLDMQDMLFWIKYMMTYFIQLLTSGFVWWQILCIQFKRVQVNDIREAIKLKVYSWFLIMAWNLLLNYFLDSIFYIVYIYVWLLLADE